MNPESILAGTASLFMALGDKTRLRLLNLMRDREICVSSFTGTLGHSQPLISRHLAYLRNSGIVEARRDGKWMHYSISTNLDDNTRRLLFELFRWMEGQEGLRVDREQYKEAYPTTETAAVPEPKQRVSRQRSIKTAAPIYEEELFEEQVAELPDLSELTDPDPVYSEEVHAHAHHNELEDFLL